MKGLSIKVRLVLVFILLALGMAGIFMVGAQKAFVLGWHDAARPLIMDYVSKLAAEVAPPPSGTPSVERARALTERLPVTVRISGPTVNWVSHPRQDWHDDSESDDANYRERGSPERGWQHLVTRHTADGHAIQLGLNVQALQHRTNLFGFTVAAMLLLALLAFLYVRRLLRPLDHIRAGAQRFGAGEFDHAIPVRHPQHPDELGQLAATINTMGQDIHQMLEAKRALLLAISHELRSPLTRARLNTELLPESPDLAPQRQALLRDLQEMNRLIADLLESERLASPHAALQREPVDLPALAREVALDLQSRHAGAAAVLVQADAPLPTLSLDPTRMRLLLRNLLDNALRFSADARQAPQVIIQSHSGPGGPSRPGITLQVRDFGPGMPEDQLPHLGQAFYRPDSARTRSAGGVGLGLYLCRLVAQAHGGSMTARNAGPGLVVEVVL